MIFMNSYKVVAGVCGILAPIVSFIGMTIAIAVYPSFSWTTNYVSHLGSEGAVSEPFFNYGIIASGILLFVFSFGLLKSLENKISKYGCLVMAGAAVGLVGLGVFNLPHELHLEFTIPFFLLVPASQLVIGIGFLINNQKRIGRLTIISGVATSVFAAFTAISSLMDLPVFAIFETLSSTSGNIWVFAISILLIRKKI